MSLSNSGDGSSQAPEELDDEVLTSEEVTPMPKKNIFNEYGYNAKIIAKNIFKLLLRTYERPDNNYYVVITPYGKRKGMTIVEVIKMIRKRWAPLRLIVTLERFSKGKPINPHYNIIITTKKLLKDSNSNCLNINVQDCQYIKDMTKAIDYSFKQYVKPLNRCIFDKHFYAWCK